MGARNVMIQYVGDILYLPKFERPVRRIIEQRYDISPSDRQEFKPVQTCKMEVSGTPCEGNTDKTCTACGAYNIGAFYDDMAHISTPKFCPNCGAKAVK